MTIDGSNDAQNVRRKRLLFRAARRGFREVDMIFGTYAARSLGNLGDAGLDAFEALLSIPDQQIYDWLRGAAPVPPAYDTQVFQDMKALCSRKNPTWNV